MFSLDKLTNRRLKAFKKRLLGERIERCSDLKIKVNITTLNRKPTPFFLFFILLHSCVGKIKKENEFKTGISIQQQ